jgi:hypothetical protein
VTGTVVSGPVVTNFSGAPGTLVTATVSCPASKTIVAGGSNLNAPHSGKVALLSSYATSTKTWTAVGIVLLQLLPGEHLTVQAVVICSG